MISNIVAGPSIWRLPFTVTGKPGKAVRCPILVPILFLAGCSSATQGPSPGWSPQVSSGFTPSAYQVPASPRVISGPVAVPKGGGVYKVGNPYQVAGQWYEPREEPGYDRAGVASWYGEDFHGRKTSNGEVYDMMALTAAHPTLPMPSYAFVTNMANNRTVLVRINDRGPYARGRIIDLSNGAARALGVIAHGTGQVRVRYAGPAPLDGNDWKERKHLASQPWSGQSAIAAADHAPAIPRLSTPAPSQAQSWSPDSYRTGLKTGLGGRS
jgi:rare lipoprotein A